MIITDKVTYIGYAAFNNSGITFTSVDLSNATVCENAFTGTTIKKLVLGGEELRIEHGGFFLETELHPFYNVKGFETLEIKQGATVVYNKLTDSMRATMKEVVLPNSITSIRDYAFTNCVNLKQEMIITDKVTYIGYDAFNNSGITFTSVDLSNATVCENAFTGTTIKKLVLGSEKLHIEHGGFFLETKQHPFYNVKGFETLEIKQGATIVFNELSASMRKTVENVTVPKSVTTIYDEVFKDCISLKEIKLPRGVKTSTNTFSNCPAKITYY